MTINLSDFITKDLQAPFVNVTNYAHGYETSNIYILMQQAQRQKLIKTNYLSDLSQLEKDPNYSKKYYANQAKVQKLISQLSLSTHISTTASSLITMLGVQEFIPSNVKSMLFNYQTLSDSSANFFNTVQQGDIFKQVGVKLLSDLLSNYSNGVINFDKLVLLSQAVSNNTNALDNVQNNGIKSLLSLPLNYIFDGNMTSILSDATFLQNLYTIFNNEAPTVLNYVAALNGQITTYSNTRVDSIVDSNFYSNQNITLQDPLGLSLQQAFADDINKDYTQNIAIINQNVAAQYNVSPGDTIILTQILVNNASNNVTQAFEKDLGLPSITNILVAVNAETYNTTMIQINQAFESFANQIILNTNINPPSDSSVSSIDYLVNLKKNLEVRENLKIRGTTSEQLNNIDSIIAQYVPNGFIDEQVIQRLKDEMAFNG